MLLNRTCLLCGDAFTTQAAWVKRGGGKYCGRACADAAPRPQRVNLAEHFWTRVDKNGPPHPYQPHLGPCWLWTGARYDTGYGEAAVNSRPRGAHRVAWELTNGAIPLGQLVCHSCDNPPCCNPAHLFLSTDAGNALDKVKKGRAPTKISAEAVLAIRARHASGEQQLTLARDFGLSKNMVWLIVNRKAWKHI